MIKKGFVIGIVIVFLVGSLASGISINKKETAHRFSRSILYVGGSEPGNYTTIQSAIDDANPGDTIFVYNGTYYENVEITKDSIKLIGEDKYTTIIDANDTGDGISIKIKSHYMEFSNFTIKNANGSGIAFQDPISKTDVKYNKISNCIIYNSSVNSNYYSGNGIRLGGHDAQMTGNLITNCEFFNNDANGVRISRSAYGSFNDNKIIDCKIYSNGYQAWWGERSKAGIATGQHSSGLYNTEISGCEIFNNAGDGINQNDSIYNTKIKNCKIYDNIGIGINFTKSSNGCIISHNNLINNGQNAYDEGSNTWDNGEFGNYWSDYTGIDSDSDGIGDTPYSISGGSNQDNYPLMYPWYPSHPDAVYVDDDYDNSTPGWGYDKFNRIQYGINEVPEGGNVYVYNGTYFENIEIDKTLNLIGEDKFTTIIDGGVSNYPGDVIYVYADNVNISGFTIQNGADGINFHSSYNTVIDIALIYNVNGIVIANQQHGNIIKNSYIYSSSHYGIHTDCSNNNIIVENEVANSGLYGIYLYSSSDNNFVFHNNLFNNTGNAYGSGANNIWDNGYPSGGNYWDDYNGTDSDGDGIGDTPYNISGGNNQDRYPLMYHFGPPYAYYTYDNVTSVFDASSSGDYNGEIVNWTWYFQDGTNGYGEVIHHKYCEIGTYHVTLIVTDDDGLIDIFSKHVEVINANIPPYLDIDGPSQGKPGVIYEYIFTVIDPDEDEFYLWVDWGDGDSTGWMGPYYPDPSIEIKLNNAWNETGTYIIKAKIRDFCGESDWVEFTINIPRDKAMNNMIFLKFLARFQLLGRLLNII